jgi:excisionase family DNA binding protein
MSNQNSFSTRQAADVLELSMSTVQRMADEGQLPSYRTPGGYRRLDAGAVLDYKRTRLSSTVTLLEPIGGDVA